MFLPLPHVQGLLHLHEFNKQQNPFHNLYIQYVINVMASVLVSVAPAFQYVFLTQRYVHSAGRWF
jgi:hypothetical protein